MYELGRCWSSLSFAWPNLSVPRLLRCCWHVPGLARFAGFSGLMVELARGGSSVVVAGRRKFDRLELEGRGSRERGRKGREKRKRREKRKIFLVGLGF